ncbi:DUF4348 domain-containing protein [Flavobacterium sp.]|uniref:DUF4348 domain-containing protein n=1 Tax=Flavobacterium sp. TaxID=239 RepID=UPI0039E62573
MKKILFLLALPIFFCQCKDKRIAPKKIDEPFNAFLLHFNTDTVFQKSRVVFPLVTMQAETENSDQLSKKFITEADYQSIDLSWNDSYTQQVLLNDRKATIQIRGVDNGIHTDVFFEKKNGQWKLVGWTDLSD